MIRHLSTGAAFQPFSSIDLLHRAERLRRAGTGWRRRCVLWPGRPWTTSPSPWTAGTACGCTLAAHRLGRVAHRRPTTGGTPPEPPAALRAAQLFEISQKPENRHRRTRARNPLRLGDRGSRGPVREGAPGGAALGVWGCKPPAWERPRRGGDRASEARRGGPWTPPFGGLFTPKGRTTLRSNV